MEYLFLEGNGENGCSRYESKTKTAHSVVERNEASEGHQPI